MNSNVEEETGMSRAHLTETPSSPQLENIDIAGINNDNGGNVSQGGGIAQPQPRQPVPEPIAPRRGRGRLLPRQSTDQPNKKFQEYMKTLSERIVKVGGLIIIKKILIEWLKIHANN